MLPIIIWRRYSADDSYWKLFKIWGPFNYYIRKQTDSSSVVWLDVQFTKTTF